MTFTVDKAYLGDITDTYQSKAGLWIVIVNLGFYISLIPSHQDRQDTGLVGVYSSLFVRRGGNNLLKRNSRKNKD